jgi:predicted nuclease of predicted toxin-antitoxin system
MRLLLDQGLPRTAAGQLRQAGIDTLHVGEIGFSEAEDAEILQRGRDDARVVVTLDADFHALLARSDAGLPSVIRIRIEGLRAEALARLLQDVLSRCERELEQGAVVTVQPATIRIRRLPLRTE